MSNEVNDLYNSLNTAAKYANLETIQDKLNKINALCRNDTYCQVY